MICPQVTQLVSEAAAGRHLPVLEPMRHRLLQPSVLRQASLSFPTLFLPEHPVVWCDGREPRSSGQTACPESYLVLGRVDVLSRLSCKMGIMRVFPNSDCGMAKKDKPFKTDEKKKKKKMKSTVSAQLRATIHFITQSSSFFLANFYASYKTPFQYCL